MTWRQGSFDHPSRELGSAINEPSLRLDTNEEVINVLRVQRRDQAY